MTFSIPADSLRAPLMMGCSSGITATIANPQYDLCNGKPFYVPVGTNQYTVLFTNTTSYARTIGPSVTVTYTDHAGESRIASSTVTIVPNTKQVPTPINQVPNVAANALDAVSNFLTAARGLIFGN